MQNNNSLDAYKRLIEVSSSINLYESVEKNNFFAAEIWECDDCSLTQYPIWQTNASSISEIKKTVFLKNFLKKFSSVFIFNDWLIVGVSFPIYSYKIINDQVFQKKTYTLIFYKKALDFKIFNNHITFFQVFTIIIILIFIFTTFIVVPPISFLKLKIEKNTAKNIESKTLENIKNMIEHELINQENILKYPFDLKSSINAAIHHNNVAQIILRKVRIENINPIEVLEEVWKNIGNTSIVLTGFININYKLKFDRSTLYIAFNTILKNAVHESINTTHIHVKISQNLYQKLKNIVIIEISNNGHIIPKIIRNKIFSGFSNKRDGHGIGLKNLKQILKKTGSNLKLNKNDKTCFSFAVKTADEVFKISQEFTFINSEKDCIIETPISLLDNHKPLVVIIEDNELIWNGWKTKMHDANILFFRNPDEFFFYLDEEKIHERTILSSIKAIICDFDFGNGINFINSNLIGGIENEEDNFNGYFILCTGFNEKIKKEIPNWMLNKIDLFFQKRPLEFQEIKAMIKKSKSTKNYQSNF